MSEWTLEKNTSQYILIQNSNARMRGGEMGVPPEGPVGFIGLGVMGGAIVTRLRAADVPLVTYDVAQSALDRARDLGASIASSVKEVADRCEIAFACLPSIAISKDVALGPGGVHSGATLKAYVEISTIGSDTVLEIARGLEPSGIQVVDCPIIGGTVAVNAGDAGVLASGPEAAFKRILPLLELYAGRVFYLGEEAGKAQMAKVMNNAVGLSALLATCEAIAFGLKAGIDVNTSLAIMNQGSGANYLTQRVYPTFYGQGRYEGMGSLRVPVKDMACFLEEAARLGIDTPMAMSANALLGEVWRSGEPDRDTLQALHFFTRLAGVEEPA